MQNPYHNQVAEVEARQNELRRRADRARIVQAYAVQKRSPFYAPLLASTGKLLMNMGNRLNNRYGRTIEELREGLQHDPHPDHAEFTA